jgi:hypothetical protein
MGLVVLALLCGRKSLKAIARFGRQHGAPLAHALGFRRAKTPSASTLSRTLRRFDAARLEAALSRWVAGRVGPDTFHHISIDGKVLRGSRDGDVPGQHLVAAYAPAAEAVLAQVRVDSKTNEHKAALQLLGILPLAGKVVVGDAMFCQRDLAEQVVGAGGDYVLVVKDNQHGLAVDIEAGFTFEHAARGVAAATSPWGHPRVAPARTRGEFVGQGARAGGAADAGDDADPDGGPAVEGAEARAPCDSREDGAGEEVGGGGPRDHEPAGGSGGRGETPGAAAEPLAGRERLALRPGRDAG